MWVHYDTHAIAIDHLQTNGWVRMPINGCWLSQDRTCKATIHPTNTDVVAICYQEV